MSKDRFDRYKCPAGHSFLVARVVESYREKFIPCAYSHCNLWAEFEGEETIGSGIALDKKKAGGM